MTKVVAKIESQALTILVNFGEFCDQFKASGTTNVNDFVCGCTITMITILYFALHHEYDVAGVQPWLTAPKEFNLVIHLFWRHLLGGRLCQGDAQGMIV